MLYSLSDFPSFEEKMKTVLTVFKKSTGKQVPWKACFHSYPFLSFEEIIANGSVDHGFAVFFEQNVPEIKKIIKQELCVTGENKFVCSM